MANEVLICSVEGCNRSILARGLCGRHYQKWRICGDPAADRQKKRGICTIEGCGKPVKGRGWCQAHYKKWRVHGSPTAGFTEGELLKFYQEVVLTYRGDQCLIWPFGTDSHGYARMRFKGEKRTPTVSRRVCEDIHGPAPSPAHQAAHSCSNGHLGCVAPTHTEWQTPKQNCATKMRIGTTNRGARAPSCKLSEDDVRAIRLIIKTQPARVAAETFNVSLSEIYSIKHGKKWAWLDG